MNKLTVVLSGKKSSGKTSVAKYILSEFLNAKIGQPRFVLNEQNKQNYLVDTFNDQIIPLEYPEDSVCTDIFNAYSVKLYSFNDPVKRICIDLFGLDSLQCYGCDDDKNTATHISWDDLPTEIREKHSRPRRGSGEKKIASGFMTAKELMGVVEHDLFRRIDQSAWARGLYSVIDKDGYELAIVDSAKFPSEVSVGTENYAKVIRLLRHCNTDISETDKGLDEFPLGEYSLVVDNHKMTLRETYKKIRPYIHTLFKDRKLI